MTEDNEQRIKSLSSPPKENILLHYILFGHITSPCLVKFMVL